jgi:hypothetical protein
MTNLYDWELHLYNELLDEDQKGLPLDEEGKKRIEHLLTVATNMSQELNLDAASSLCQRMWQELERMTMIDEERCITAYHEAGHVIANSSLGFIVTSVEIVGSYGLTRRRGSMPRHAYLITALAGPISQARYERTPLRRYACTDLERADGIARDLVLEGRFATTTEALQFGEHTARALVVREWDTIE